MNMGNGDIFAYTCEGKKTAGTRIGIENMVFQTLAFLLPRCDILTFSRLSRSVTVQAFERVEDGAQHFIPRKSHIQTIIIPYTEENPLHLARGQINR